MEGDTKNKQLESFEVFLAQSGDKSNYRELRCLFAERLVAQWEQFAFRLSLYVLEISN